MERAPAKHKTIIVRICGSDGMQSRDVMVTPGTSPRDILKKLEYHTHVLNRGDGYTFDAAADLFPQVVDGQKVYLRSTLVYAS